MISSTNLSDFVRLEIEPFKHPPNHANRERFQFSFDAV